MEPEADVQEVLETPEEESTEDVELQDLDQELADLKAKAERADELEQKNRQLYERLKKKEDAPSQDAPSLKDIMALKDANVSSNDLDEVLEFAKYKKIGIAEALSNPTLKAILRDKAEEKRTAQATETKSPRGIAKNTGEDVLRKAEQSGEVPESAEGLRALVEARFARRRK